MGIGSAIGAAASWVAETAGAAAALAGAHPVATGLASSAVGAAGSALTAPEESEMSFEAPPGTEEAYHEQYEQRIQDINRKWREKTAQTLQNLTGVGLTGSTVQSSVRQSLEQGRQADLRQAAADYRTALAEAQQPIIERDVNEWAPLWQGLGTIGGRMIGKGLFEEEGMLFGGGGGGQRTPQPSMGLSPGWNPPSGPQGWGYVPGAGSVYRPYL